MRRKYNIHRNSLRDRASVSITGICTFHTPRDRRDVYNTVYIYIKIYNTYIIAHHCGLHRKSAHTQKNYTPLPTKIYP